VKSARVLIIEDDDTTRTLLKTVMAREYVEFVSASDGAEALKLIDGEPFAAIVLDLLLPKVDGFEIIRHIKETNPRLLKRVVVLTGAPESTLRDRADLSSVRCVLRKPVELDQLSANVLQCLTQAAEDISSH
jgi:CheY-like chemotaxis protein